MADDRAWVPQRILDNLTHAFAEYNASGKYSHLVNAMGELTDHLENGEHRKFSEPEIVCRCTHSKGHHTWSCDPDRSDCWACTGGLNDISCLSFHPLTVVHDPSTDGLHVPPVYEEVFLDENRLPRVAKVNQEIRPGQMITAQQDGEWILPWLAFGGEDPAVYDGGRIIILEEAKSLEFPEQSCVISARVTSWDHPRILFGHPNPDEDQGMTFCRALDGLSYRRDEIISFEVLWEDTKEGHA